ncbi:recombinase family protein [Novosphingobium sp. MBES04]|uniref:recombinase family protein n=1 Tax=Novosphingobium sp. MBES04 TaxID=1206458 RepID=UPI00131F3689|nr:recombinase family protein [Novosphingobium sp. MBES04]
MKYKDLPEFPPLYIEPPNFSSVATIKVECRNHPKPRGRHALYLRCSSRPHSKLDVAQQLADAQALLAIGRGSIIKTFTEEEPLSDGKRPELEKAIAFCKAEGARIILGKIAGMRGGYRWLKRLHDEGIYFMGADDPTINRLDFYQIVWRENRRRDDIGRKIKQALAETKAQGTTLGGKRANASGLELGPAASAISRKQRALSRSLYTMSKIREIQHRGVTSLTGIATRLNQMKHPTPRGGQWSPAQVRAVIKRCEG